MPAIMAQLTFENVALSPLGPCSMFKALRFFAWPLLAGVLIAMLIIQRYPQWVGLPSQDVNLQQAPQSSTVQQGPVSYADAVIIAAPAVANLYTTKVVNK